MPTFDPDNLAPEGAIPNSGRYAVQLQAVKRKVSQAGRDYISMCFRVLSDGAFCGAEYWSNLQLDVTKMPIAQRLAAFLRASEVRGAVEIGSTRDGTAAEGDQLFRGFVGRGYVVTIAKSGEFVNWDRTHQPAEYSRDEREALDSAQQSSSSGKFDPSSYSPHDTAPHHALPESDTNGSPGAGAPPAADDGLGF